MREAGGSRRLRGHGTAAGGEARLSPPTRPPPDPPSGPAAPGRLRSPPLRPPPRRPLPAPRPPPCRLTAPQHRAQPSPRSPLCSPRKTSLNFRSGLPNSPPLPGADMAARRGRAGAVTEEKERPPSTHRHRRPARRAARHFRRSDGVTSAAAAMASPARHCAAWRRPRVQPYCSGSTKRLFPVSCRFIYKRTENIA